jgi:hypothetical protein
MQARSQGWRRQLRRNAHRINHNLDQPARALQEFEDTIFGQDQW